MREHIGLVIPVATFGRPVPQAPWHAFREKTGIPVVIDGGASFAGVANKADAFLGNIPVGLSLHATKCFATGEGGAVVSCDTDLVVRASQALNFGFLGSRDSRTASTNGKMSEYHAAVGRRTRWLGTQAAGLRRCGGKIPPADGRCVLIGMVVVDAQCRSELCPSSLPERGQCRIGPTQSFAIWY